MNKKLLTGVIIAIVAVGGIAALVLGKDPATSSKTTSNTTTHADGSRGASHANDTNESEESSAAAVNTVAIENFDYGPANITVKKGTTVTWTNKDSVQHTVTADDGQSGPDSELLSQGETYSFTYDTVGTFSYHCAPHPNMTGSVTVTE